MTTKKATSTKAAVKKVAPVRKKVAPLHWKDICRSLWMAGLMKDFSKRECLRVNGLLAKQIKGGKVEKVGRGVYQIEPELLAKLDQFEPPSPTG